MSRIIYLYLLLTISWLQAAYSRDYRYFASDVEEDYEQRDHFKRIAEKLRDYLSNKDPYFGDHDAGDDQPEITEKDLPANGENFEGDMIMDDRLRRAVLGLNKKRSAIEQALDGHKRHWPNGIVPYLIDESLKPHLRDRVKEAIENFRRKTCIRFVKKTDADKDYVLFKDGKGCSSSVGRQGGEQAIHLAAGCERIGTVQHEMMHALGMVHEQSRSDRDEHIKVRFDHIKEKLRNNFRKYDFGELSDLKTPYNFFSVMHYSNHAFSNDGKATLISIHDPNLHFGQRVQWTCLDLKQINRLYGCPARTHCKGDDELIPDMTERDVERRKRDEMRDLYDNLFDKR